MNIGTWLVTAGLCAVVALIVRKLIRDKRAGKTCSGCSGSCGGTCHCGKK